MSYLDVVGVEYAEETYAKKSGEYPDLTAGTAEGLIGQSYEVDQSAYLYRKSHEGGRVREQIVGGTVAWNQMIHPVSQLNMYTRANGSVSYDDSEGCLVYTLVASEQALYHNVGIKTSVSKNSVVGRKYLYGTTFKFNVDSNNFIIAPIMGKNVTVGNVTANVKTTNRGIIEATNESGVKFFYYPFGTGSMVADGTEAVRIYNHYITDLTAMFGSTIADYVYSLEQTTAGAGVAWLKQYIDLDTYHEYNAGSLASVQTEGREVVGFNQWDEEWERGSIYTSNGQPYNSTTDIRSKNFNTCIGGATYYGKSSGTNQMILYWYDVDKNYLSFTNMTNMKNIAPSDAAYFKIRCATTTYNHDICINISDPAKNGTYKPYEKRTYPVSNIELRGIPKLVDNQLAFDGDMYAADGTVTRKYGEYTFTGEETWEYVDTYGAFTTTKNIGAYRHVAQNGYVEFGIMSNGFSQYGRCNADMPDRAFANNSGAHGANKIYIKDTRYTAETIADFKASIAGVKLAFLLATPTTETADPYAPVQAVGNTERWIDSRAVPVPVGQNSKYYPDYADKIDRLPSDFSTLIAPTEATYTATRNYASGDYLIVDNQLYMVTTAIANGGTITVGTNVRATTIVEIIQEILSVI